MTGCSRDVCGTRNLRQFEGPSLRKIKNYKSKIGCESGSLLRLRKMTTNCRTFFFFGCQMILYFSFSFAVLNSVGEKRNLSVAGQKTLSPLLSISRTFYSISKDTLAPPPVFTLILTISVQKQLTAGHSTAPLLISSMMS